MRSVHRAVGRLAPLAVIAGLMALPAMASAAPMYWGEYDYDPLGGTPTSETPVTVDFTGTITLDDYQPDIADATCEVAGEIRLANDWDHPSGTPATNQIVSIAPAGSVAQSCTGLRYNVCSVTDVTFSGLPWSGVTDDSSGSSFENVSTSVKHQSPNFGCSGLAALVAAGDITGASPFSYGSGQGDCIDGFEIYPSFLAEGQIYAYVSGLLEFDLDTLEGLSTNAGGPCVTLNYL